jgi:hypothetical protein
MIMTEQTETPEATPQTPFAALSEAFRSAFPGYRPRTDAAAEEDDEMRGIRAFALAQAVETQKTIGIVGHSPDAVNKEIISRAAAFTAFVTGVDS